MSNIWQQAWDAAQPRLHSIQNVLASPTFPVPNSRIIRVGQLDAELLDAELVHILTEPVSKALATVNVRVLCVSMLSAYAGTGIHENSV
jgi:peroxin-2